MWEAASEVAKLAYDGFSILKRIVGDVGDVILAAWSLPPSFSILKRIVGDVGLLLLSVGQQVLLFQYPQADRG